MFYPKLSAPLVSSLIHNSLALFETNIMGHFCLNYLFRILINDNLFDRWSVC